MKKEYHLILKNADIRPSIQRVAIYAYLCEHPCHPDVETVYDELFPLYPTLSKTKIEEYNKESIYGYKYQYTYEAMIPYEVIGLSQKPKYLNFSFAVKTPNEKAYIYYCFLKILFCHVRLNMRNYI